MELSIFGLEHKIIFDDSHVNILEIKDKKFFRKILFLLNNNTEEENEIVLTDNLKRLAIDKETYMVFDLYNFEYNSKKILNKLYTIIADNIKLSEKSDLEELVFKFRNFLIKEINELPFEFKMKSDIEIENVLKIFDLRIDESCYLELLEKVEFLIDIIKEFRIARILVLPNLKNYFTNEELVEIYKYAKYNDVYLLIIQNDIEENILKYEKKYIIDDEFDDFIKVL